MRVTAILRELLILEWFEHRLQRRRRELTRQLAAAGVRIVDRMDSELDVTIRYTERDWERQAVYMRPMLEAEAAGRLRKAGIQP
ncbi:hypothetical protein GCM10010885_04740 [Alicyclobacillus cellulosilyticus]|uniref:Uncharacterized protein n=1 Tax=Alicyclobacillus cellulosilyticus TaxID=1003997 RepID=A0A917K326_9BACL|nr:hypothetical protein [Alicyclobacillus cellulosilyticus]GGI98198.1 hypothetical protein GCM10010885_04740 [Alicyclobacillus cellulosilyticus]